MSFGTFIREHRQRRGLTVKEVAMHAGISVGYLSRIERDREKAPRDELIRRIARTIDLTDDEAFAAARRLPPDLQSRAREVFAAYRSLGG